MLFLLLLVVPIFSTDFECVPRTYDGENNIVCVCNSTYCDELNRVLASNEVFIVQSSLSGMRFDTSIVEFTTPNFASDDLPSIFVDARHFYQKILGFGGAFTDAAGINIASLSPKTQENLLNSYFSKTGIEYSIGRVPMASNDFSTRVYSYDDVFGDFELTHFSLAPEDFQFKIPFIQKALELTEGKLKLLSTPWGPPGWMKTSGEMPGPGPLLANPKVHEAYAQYFVRFFEEYKKQNISFWASTIQNEPIVGALLLYPAQSVYFTAKTQKEFVKNFLGPALKSNNLTKDIQLICLDDESALLLGWANEMYSDEYVWSVVAGMGIHWYVDVITPSMVLSLTHNLYPEKFILNTEACARIFPGKPGSMLGYWSRAETYADSIITDLNNWVGGWVDWNMCLDEDGGPSGFTIQSIHQLL